MSEASEEQPVISYVDKQRYIGAWAVIVVIIALFVVAFVAGDWTAGSALVVPAAAMYLLIVIRRRTAITGASFYDQRFVLTKRDGTQRVLTYSQLTGAGIRSTGRRKAFVSLFISGETKPVVLHDNPKAADGTYLHPWLLKRGVSPAGSMGSGASP